ncbi:MAG: enoyl-CoA hydratase [Rhodobacteraceae bacterium]|jgi:enoyl-CoA hydratase/carnithine racemase|nr:enoyl-CoA hydratase [Paracoccaceae bacterium]
MKYVKVSQEGPVSVVVFESGPKNYFGLDLIVELAEAFERIDQQPEQRAIVLASEGKVFCAGADFAGQDAGGGDPGALYREALRLFKCRKPVVAAIQGAAIGGGLGLSLVADFRVGAAEARFAANFVHIGIHPGFGLTYTLPRVIGQRAASRLFLAGTRINGEEAARIGLLDELVPLEDVRAAAIRFAGTLANGAPLAVQSTRETLRAGMVEAIEKQTEREQSEQVKLFKTNDFAEGVAAVNERRAGNWTAT